MRRALPTLGAVLGALALPATAAAAVTEVVMPGKYFEPARPQVVAGDQIAFRNADVVTHDVRIAAGGFDSGPIGRFGRWAQPIETAGSYPFLCTLHPFMSGTLEVVNATIAASPEAAVAGEPLAIAGRAPAGTAAVGLVRVDADGSVHVLPGAPTEADGRYLVTTDAVEGARYRVTTPRGDSPEVAPQVTARLKAHLTVRHGGGKLRLRVHTMPAASGLSATLQLYDRWHYRWRRTRTVTLDVHGSAWFTLPGATRAYARVTLRRRPGAAALVHSGVVTTHDGRPARDPEDRLTPAYGGQGGHGGH